jgi:tRNA pseudouridine38-40 synthase
MVRSIIGTLVEIGSGRRDRESVRELLNTRARAKVGQTAPPYGLYLVRVDYDTAVRYPSVEDVARAGPGENPAGIA